MVMQPSIVARGPSERASQASLDDVSASDEIVADSWHSKLSWERPEQFPARRRTAKPIIAASSLANVGSESGGAPVQDESGSESDDSRGDSQSQSQGQSQRPKRQSAAHAQAKLRKLAVDVLGGEERSDDESSRSPTSARHSNRLGVSDDQSDR